VKGEISVAGETKVDLSKIARGVFLLVMNDGHVPIVSQPFILEK
jgi:hypothetical protein